MKLLRITAILLIMLMLVSCGYGPETDETGDRDTQNETDEDEMLPDKTEEEYMWGLWVATAYGLDYPDEPSTDADELTAEAEKILDFAAETGFTAVFLQVRSAADAIYKSEIFPWSQFLTGEQGKAPDDGFDPLEMWVEEAHERGLELHAWVNPYRVSRKAGGKPASDVETLASGHPARENPELVRVYKDGCLYFDPGLPQARELITLGVKEIAENYDVDGIHFDDYFYPGPDFDDKETYEKYAEEDQSRDDFRRASVDKLIEDVYKTVKEQRPECEFGVSPFGIWANASSVEGGSETRGSESYFRYFADSKGWVEKGIVDYIAPQIYWEVGHESADYETLVKWWCDTVRGTGVRLYIGHAAYRAGESDEGSPWRGTYQIEKQLSLNEEYPEISGSIFFRYGSTAEYPELAETVSAFAMMHASD